MQVLVSDFKMFFFLNEISLKITFLTSLLLAFLYVYFAFFAHGRSQELTVVLLTPRGTKEDHRKETNKQTVDRYTT